MTTRQQEIERGHQARQLIEHPLWLESWEQWEAGILKAWTDTPVRDTEAREALFLGLHAGRRARRQIETVFQTGKLALAQVEAENARRERKT